MASDYGFREEGPLRTPVPGGFIVVTKKSENLAKKTQLKIKSFNNAVRFLYCTLFKW